MDEPGAPATPSGRQADITSGGHEATVVEVGGGIRSYRAGGRDVLDGYAAGDPCTSSRGLPLIPWPNRLAQGRYTFDGQQYQAPVNEVGKGNALHGYTRWHNWVLSTPTPSEAVASLRLHPQQGYPFVLDLTVTYAVGPEGLTVTTTARNVGAVACPYAYGAHPYFTVGTDLIDAAVLTLPAAACLLTDDAQIPTGTAPVGGTDLDFRGGRILGATRLDHAFTDLHRDADGLARARLSSDDTGRAVTVWVDDTVTHLMVFTGDTLGDEGRRRRGLAVEPMTAPPNAFATGEARRLEPGEATTTRWGVTVHDG